MTATHYMVPELPILALGMWVGAPSSEVTAYSHKVNNLMRLCQELILAAPDDDKALYLGVSGGDPFRTPNVNRDRLVSPENF